MVIYGVLFGGMHLVLVGTSIVLLPVAARTRSVRKALVYTNHEAAEADFLSLYELYKSDAIPPQIKCVECVVK